MSAEIDINFSRATFTSSTGTTQPRSQDLSSSHPWSGRKEGREEERLWERDWGPLWKRSGTEGLFVAVYDLHWRHQYQGDVFKAIFFSFL